MCVRTCARRAAHGRPRDASPARAGLAAGSSGSSGGPRGAGKRAGGEWRIVRLCQGARGVARPVPRCFVAVLSTRRSQSLRSCARRLPPSTPASARCRPQRAVRSRAHRKVNIVAAGMSCAQMPNEQTIQATVTELVKKLTTSVATTEARLPRPLARARPLRLSSSWR
jgi:hypothetical protein